MRTSGRTQGLSYSPGRSEYRNNVSESIGCTEYGLIFSRVTSEHRNSVRIRGVHREISIALVGQSIEIVCVRV